MSVSSGRPAAPTAAATPGRWPAALKCLLPFAAGIFAAGFLADTRHITAIQPRIPAVTIALAIAAIVAGTRGRPAGRGSLFVLVLFGAGFLRAALPLMIPPSPRLIAALATRDSVVVSGIADRVERRASGACRIALRLRAIGSAGPDSTGPAWGTLSLTWPDSIAPPLEGAHVAVRTIVEPIKGATNPGGWDARQNFFRQGITARAVLRRPRDLVAHRPPPLLSLGRGLARLRAAMGGAIDRRMDGFARRFARVLLMGDRVAFRPEEEADFRAAGVTHILSVSGLHVGLVAATVQLLLGRRRRPSALAIALGATWGYTVLVGAPAAAVRSAAMLTMVMVARHAKRSLAGPPLLSGAAFCLLVASPLLLFDLGFLLSTLSVAGLLAAHHLLSALPALERAPRPLRVVAETFGLTFGAQAATAPITIALWGDWPLVAPIANLLVVGLSDFVLTSGLLALALDLFQPAAASRVFAVTWGLSKIVGWSVHQLAIHSPGVTGLTAPPGWVPAAYVATAAGAVAAFTGGRRRAAAALGAAWCVTFALLVAAPRLPPAGLRVTALDVGQGDATLLEFPDGASLLVDAGEGGLKDNGGRVAWPAIRAARLRQLDAVVLSHAHSDHEGGLLNLLARARVKRVYDTGLGPGDGEPAAFREICRRRRVAICLAAAGDTLLSGRDYRVTVLWPPRPADPADDYERPPGELNDLSLVLLVEWRGRRLILPGDLEGAAERDLVMRLPAGAIGVDYLKAGHHGSRTSSRPEWLDRLRPRIASVSVGIGNKFRHPSREVMSRYAAAGIAVHRTDRAGALRLTWRRDGLCFEEWGDGERRRYRRGFVPFGAEWPSEFLDASGAIW